MEWVLQPGWSVLEALSKALIKPRALVRILVTGVPHHNIISPRLIREINPGYRDLRPLLLTKDDYSRRVVGGRLVERESAWEHLCVTRGTIEEVGGPLACGQSQHSPIPGLRQPPLPLPHPLGEGRQQFQRALRALDIGLIYTGKGEAQAKGKIEKQFDYFQRRLGFLCEKYRATELQKANVEATPPT